MKASLRILGNALPAFCLAAALARSGVAAEVGQLKWTFDTGGPVFSCPAIGADGTVYVGSRDWSVFAFEGATGRLRWRFQSGGEVDSSPAIGADGTVYVGSSDYRVYALNGVSGQKLWEFQTDRGVLSSPAIGGDGTIYVGSDDHHVYAVNGATGQERWRFRAAGPVDGSPAIGADGSVYIGVGMGGMLYALDGGTGQPRWEYRETSYWISSPAMGPTGMVLVSCVAPWPGEPGCVLALDGVTGERRWRVLADEPASVSSCPAIGVDGTVYVGLGDRLYAWSGETGAKRWKFRADDAIQASPTVAADGTVYVGSRDQKLYALDGQTGEKRWEFVTDAPIRSSPAIGPDGTVYLGSWAGTFHALEGRSGLAQSSWPKFRSNAMNTGRVGDAPAGGPPEILQSPVGVRVAVGGSFVLSVSATGRWPLTYQWHRTGQPIAGAVGEVLNVSNARLEQGGDYYVAVRNALGGATSAVARVVVGYPLILVTNGAGGIVPEPPLEIFEAGQEVTLTAVPRLGHVFLGWAGNATGVDNPVTLTMAGPRRVEGRFSLPPGGVKWAFETGAEVASSPAVGPDGTVYVFSTDGKLHALDGGTGAKRWECDTGGGMHSLGELSPAVGEDGTAYVASGCRLQALDGSTGVKRWEVEGGQVCCQAIAISAGGTVYAGWGDGRVEALEPLAGTSRWSSRPTTNCTDLIVGADGTLFISSGKAYGVCALDPVGGTTLWESELRAPVFCQAVGAAGMLLASDSWPRYAGRLLALDVVTGRTRWEWESTTGQANPSVGEAGVVWVADGSLKMLDGPTGQQIAEVSADDSSVVMEGWPAMAADRTIYVAANVRGIGGIYESGRVYAVDGATRTILWRFEVDGAVRSSLTIGPDGTVYVGATNPEACCTWPGVPYPVVGRRKVYALVGTAPPADTPWPMYRHDAQHTGRAVAPPAPLRLAIAWMAGKARIEWTGSAVLQTRDTLTSGTWQDVVTALSPHEIQPAGGPRFYRLRRPRRAQRKSGDESRSGCQPPQGTATCGDPDLDLPRFFRWRRTRRIQGDTGRDGRRRACEVRRFTGALGERECDSAKAALERTHSRRSATSSNEHPSLADGAVVPVLPVRASRWRPNPGPMEYVIQSWVSLRRPAGGGKIEVLGWSYEVRPNTTVIAGQPAPVVLEARRKGPQLVLSWNLSWPGWRLESSPSLAPAAWQVVPGVQDNRHVLPVAEAAGFYRLQLKP